MIKKIKIAPILSYYYKEISSESTMHSINSLLLSAGKSQKKTIIIIPTIEDLKRKERRRLQKLLMV